jgi:Eukaryotic protein of unknown function (DUF829)
MGASTRHIAKYVVLYQKLFPESAILIVRNELTDILLRPNFIQIKRLEPVIDIIEKHRTQNDDGKPRILLHNFSNGGCIQATLFAQMYRARYHRPLPIVRMIMDSCPGLEGYWPTFKAFTTPAPKFFLLRWIVYGLIHFVITAWFPVIKLFPQSGTLYRMRMALNDPTLFPLSASRIYIYSKTDELVLWQDVESHARDARGAKSEIQLELFNGSQHVGHLMNDPERYSNIIQSVSSS